MTAKTLSAHVLDTFYRLMEWKTIPTRTGVIHYKDPENFGSLKPLNIRERIIFSYENDGTDGGSEECSAGPLTTVAFVLPRSRTQIQRLESGFLLLFSVFCGILRSAVDGFCPALSGT